MEHGNVIVVALSVGFPTGVIERLSQRIGLTRESRCYARDWWSRLDVNICHRGT